MNLMRDTTDASARFQFEGYVLDTRTRELRDAGGQVLPLTARAFDTLCVLVAHRDRLVSKAELLATVWAGRVVEENNLTQAIAALRRAFGTDGQDHRFIVTVPGRGYRFVPAVQPAPAMDAGWRPWPGVEDVAVPVLPGASAPMPAGLPRTDNGHAAREPALAPPRARVMVLALALALVALLMGLLAWSPLSKRRLPAPVDARPTVAVMPFRSLSPAGRNELLELGLADTLVTRLARVDSLRVHPLASSRRAIGASADALAAGRVLGATWLVEGSAQTLGQRVRVNVRLVSVAEGVSLWSDSFDADEAEVFRLQDRIADGITGALSLRRARAVPASSPCEGAEPDAYRALLRAQLESLRRSQTALSAYRTALERDPTCAPAYAGMAIAHMFMAHGDEDPAEIFPLARVAVNRALALGPDSAVARMALGRYLQLHAWDWRGAEASLRQAIAANPSFAEAHFALAHLLVSTGRHAEGLAHARQARALDPLSPLYNALEAGFLTAAGRPDAAQVRIRQALALEPRFWVALLIRGGMALDRGDVSAALGDLRQAAQVSGRNSQVLAVLALAHAAAGQHAEVRAILDELEARQGHAYVPATSLAAVHLAAGDRAAALGQLELAYQRRDIRMAFLQEDARWNPLRDDPRFIALANRMGLSGGRATGRY